MPEQTEFHEQFRAGLWRAGPSYLAPEGSLFKAENLFLDTNANLQRSAGNVAEITGVGTLDTIIGLRPWYLGQTRHMLSVARSIPGVGNATMELFDETTVLSPNRLITTPIANGGTPWVDFAEFDQYMVISAAFEKNSAGGFIADLHKYDGDLDRITDVGMDPPASTTLVALGTPRQIVIDNMDAGWTFSAGAHDATVNLSGSSARIDTDAVTGIGTISKGGFSFPTEFAGPVGIESEDYVLIYVSSGGFNKAVTITVRLSFEAGDFTVDYMENVLSISELNNQLSGDQLAGGLRRIIGTGGTFYTLFFKRSDFTKLGTLISNKSFADVTDVEIEVASTTDGATINQYFIEDLQFWGGHEPDSDASYTQFNFGSAPGEQLLAGGINVKVNFIDEDLFESNGQTTATTTVDPKRQPIDLTVIPVDLFTPQVDDRGIFFRNLGVDLTWFFVDSIGDNVATTFSIVDDNDGLSIPINHDKPPNARYCEEYKTTLFLGATTTSEKNFVFGLPGTDFEGFPFDENPLDDNITGFAKVANGLAIFTKSSIHLLTGTDETDFSLTEIVTGKGCHAPRSIAPILGGCMFMSNDGVYFFDGVQVVKVSKNIDQYFNGEAVDELGTNISVDLDQEEHIFGVWDPVFRRYILGFKVNPVTAIQTDGPERALMFWADLNWAATEELYDAVVPLPHYTMAFDSVGNDMFIGARLGVFKVTDRNALYASQETSPGAGVQPTWHIITNEISGPTRNEPKEFEYIEVEHAPVGQNVIIERYVDSFKHVPDAVSNAINSDPKGFIDRQKKRVGFQHGRDKGFTVQAGLKGVETLLDSIRFTLKYSTLQGQ